MSEATTIPSPLRETHPQFSHALEEFLSFVRASQEDLSRKSVSLKEQRKLLTDRRHATMKNYLSCQVFMLARHRRRLERFENDVRTRLAAAAAGEDAAAESGGNAEQKKSRVEQQAENSSNVIRATARKLSSVTHVSRSKSGLNEQLVQILADMGKMKRRCKHILDVTDRYCVLTTDELLLRDSSLRLSSSCEDLRAAKDAALESPEPPSTVPPSLERSKSFFVSDSASVSSTSSPPVPSQITSNLVKSTIESFGSHLAVIAKTYTRKRGRDSPRLAINDEEEEDERGNVLDREIKATTVTV